MIAYTPKIKRCRACDLEYKYFKRLQYPGKSTALCVACQLAYMMQVGAGVGNSGHRLPGHKTRQQHKKVNPRQV
jgi:hypothetical protein